MPVSTTSRPVVHFAADNNIALDYQVVDLFTGEHMGEAYAKLNPNKMVPMLEDGDFRLTESSAILKYIADKVNSPSYPKDLKKRAKINAMMDWFNTGLYWAYGIDGPAQGHYYVDFETKKLTVSASAYEHPQPHACFIQSISDDLVNEGGIMDLWVREARLFKYGSGTGSNFSRLRGEGERLSGGGRSSGLMSFLKIGDRAAGAIKSGGTTRRAAKMVIVDADHPDIEDFIDWKVIEEQKVAAMVTGSKLAEKHLNAIIKACRNCEGSGDDCFDPSLNPALKRDQVGGQVADLVRRMVGRLEPYFVTGDLDAELTKRRNEARQVGRQLLACAKEGVAKGHDLNKVYKDTRAKLDPVYGQFPIYEHCMPFDVSRAFDEASGIKQPRIWTAQRDQEMWQALQA